MSGNEECANYTFDKILQHDLKWGNIYIVSWLILSKYCLILNYAIDKIKTGYKQYFCVDLEFRSMKTCYCPFINFMAYAVLHK